MTALSPAGASTISDRDCPNWGHSGVPGSAWAAVAGEVGDRSHFLVLQGLLVGVERRADGIEEPPAHV